MSGFNMWLCCALLKLLFFPGFVSLACFSVYFLTTVKQIIIDDFLLNQFQNSTYFMLILLIWSSVAAKCSMISQHHLFSLFLTNFWWGWCKLAKIVLQNHTTVLGCCSRDAAKHLNAAGQLTLVPHTTAACHQLWCLNTNTVSRVWRLLGLLKHSLQPVDTHNTCSVAFFFYLSLRL